MRNVDSLGGKKQDVPRNSRIKKLFLIPSELTL